MNNLNKKLIIRIVFALLIIGIIFYSSSQPYSEQNLQPLISEKVQLPDAIVSLLSKVEFTYAGHIVSVETKGVPGFIEFFIRKGAHFSIYLVLSVFVASILHIWMKRKPLKLAALTILFVFLYACSDEWHQSFNGERTPLFQDVIIDTVGGICGVLLFLLWSRRRKQNT
ncbi:hypothetical protein AC622_00875 [Bacillus sp. FJAT-27916]|uniref:VanZ family protein n=1 Tax=Bacillus sp. FJAT-27916 TaxID=1679169 RepID=UPI00067076CB|nr:VanZ family protein [Bacillus sp. FJAT-27916]KMY42995.1 hypothetical protein AC622_00875 [Bacillus sp. FJAT-27916]